MKSEPARAAWLAARRRAQREGAALADAAISRWVDAGMPLDAPEPAPAPASPSGTSGARPFLSAWRRRGDRARRDALWSAACWELAGAPSNRARAMEIMQAAARCRDPRCTHTADWCAWWAAR